MLALHTQQTGDSHAAHAHAAVKRMVVPLDGTPYAERAIPYALVLARAFGAEIVLVRAEPVESGHDSSGLPRRLARERAHVASLYLARKEQELRRAGVRVSSRVPAGPAGSAVVATARECAANLIVVATHAGSMLTHPSQISVACEILCEAQVPVLLLGGGTRQPAEPTGDEVLRLLLPLANHEGDAEERALQWQAEILARAFPCRFLVLRAAGDIGLSTAAATGAASALRPTAEGLERLRECLLAAGCAAWTALVYGDVLEETVRQACGNADLILLGLPASAKGRQRAADAAFHLLRQTALPVLLVPEAEARMDIVS
jgi:nucleotide-binding universal stress UspA family protein